jgi:large subunit ribosomal protein L6
LSRIGRKPINIPQGVELSFSNNVFRVKGAKGVLEQTIHPNMRLEIGEGTVVVTRPNDEKFNRSLHGLTRSLVANALEGVTNGFEKILEINGVGYRAQKQGSNLLMNLGFSHQVIVSETDDIKIDVQGNKVKIKGIDKQKVGQFAANVRSKRPPEPYKGKGVKYLDEIIRRKEGKAGKSVKK